MFSFLTGGSSNSSSDSTSTGIGSFTSFGSSSVGGGSSSVGSGSGSDGTVEQKSEPVKEQKRSSAKWLSDMTSTALTSTAEFSNSILDATDTRLLPYWTTLARVTHGDSDEFLRCHRLWQQIDQHLIVIGSQLPTKQPQTTWEELVEAAQVCQPKLVETANLLCQLVQKHRPGSKPEAVEAPIKDKVRATEKCKVDYGGDWSQLRDVCRAAIVHEQFSDCAVILSALLDQLKGKADKDAPKMPFNIIRIRNRYEQLTSQGWGDMHLLLCSEIPLEDGKKLAHICELQVIHRKMWDKREVGMFGHRYYEFDRAIRAKLHQGADLIGQAKSIDSFLEKSDYIRAQTGKSVFVKQATLTNDEEKKDQKKE